MRPRFPQESSLGIRILEFHTWTTVGLGLGGIMELQQKLEKAGHSMGYDIIIAPARKAHDGDDLLETGQDAYECGVSKARAYNS